MTSRLSSRFKSTDFAAGTLKTSFDAMRKLLPGKGWKVVIKAEYEGPDGVTIEKSLNSTDLSVITKIATSPKSISFQGFRDLKADVFVMFIADSGDLLLGSMGIDPEQCHALQKIFVDGLSLEAIEEDELSMSAVTESTGFAKRKLAKQLAVPDALTAKWLWDHMPWTGWALLFGSISGAFILGLKLGELKWWSTLWRLIVGP